MARVKKYWTGEFWKATFERMIRGAAIMVGMSYFGGDVVFDMYSINSWADIGRLAISGAFGSLVLSLAGNALSGNGPAFTTNEVVPLEVNGAQRLPPNV